MSNYIFLQRATDELHVDSTQQSPALKDVVERIVRLANLSATEVSALMGTEAAREMASLDVVELRGASPDSYLRPWDSIGHADPAALSNAQYDRFLRGEHPTEEVDVTVEPIRLYGADIEQEA